jgi:hypothetical protein
MSEGDLEDSMDPACEDARAAMAAFFGTGFRIAEDAERQARMRAHLESCGECSAAYHHMGQQIAGLKVVAERRAMVEARRERGFGARSRGRGLGALSVLFAMNKKPPSNKLLAVIWRLRPVLMVAFFIFLMLKVLNFGAGERLDVEWIRGAVVVDERVLSAALPKRPLGSHASLSTDANSALKIVGSEPAFYLELKENSALLLVERAPLQFVLLSGGCSMEGPFELIVDSVILTVTGLRPNSMKESEPVPAPSGSAQIQVDRDPESQVITVRVLAGSVDSVTPIAIQTLIAPRTIRFNARGQVLPDPPSGV